MTLMLALAGLEHAIEYVLPVLLVALPLLARRYPGEDALIRQMAAPGPAPSRRRVVVLPGGRSREPVFARGGGALLAASLAGRAPPV